MEKERKERLKTNRNGAPVLYLCDPNKNTGCAKTSCYTNGGPCKCTTVAEYSRDGVPKTLDEIMDGN